MGPMTDTRRTRVAIACQGGGSHTAFTAGVLKGLLGSEELAGYEFNSWLSLFAPAGTPAPVVGRISCEIQAAMRTPQMRERMLQLGYRPVGNMPEEFAAFHAAELPRVAELVRLSGAVVE